MSTVVFGLGQKGAALFDKLGGDQHVWTFSERTLLGRRVSHQALLFLVFFNASPSLTEGIYVEPGEKKGVFCFRVSCRSWVESRLRRLNPGKILSPTAG